MEEIKKLMEEIKAQEQELVFDCFNSKEALILGQMLIDHGKALGAAVSLSITLNKRQLFYYSFDGVSPDNDNWIRRKQNTVYHFFKSSYYVAMDLKLREDTIPNRYGLQQQDYVAKGGGFPIIIKNVGVVGTVTVSGLTEREDHLFAVDTIREYLKQKNNG